MTAQEASQAILSLLEEQTGKPVLLQSDNAFSGHATMKVAGPDGPAHVLRYKPEFETKLPYLIAFQCGLALRVIQCRDENRFPAPSRLKLVHLIRLDQRKAAKNR